MSNNKTTKKLLVDNKTTLKCSILVSQPLPASTNSPYHKLADAYGLGLDFRRYVKVVPIPTNEFRKHKADIPNYSAIIFTSRGTVDHFFNLCKEIKIDISPDLKYFCISEQVSNYLQKYIQLKKRKVFYGSRTVTDLLPLIKKHEKESFLFPCSEIRNNDLVGFFKKNKKPLTEIIVCKTIADDLSDISINDYGVITFFSPADVKAFISNFKNFVQGDKILATFGEKTSIILKDSGFKANIEAPTLNAPSMAKALELFFSNKI